MNAERFRCILCNAKVFDSKELLHSHLESEHHCIIDDDRLICISCNRSFAKFKYLKKHVAEVHEKMFQLSCHICKRQFNRKANMVEHMLIHENKYTAKCHVCSKSYRTPSALRLHLRMHTKEKPYKCDLCGEKSYAYNTDLKRHKRSVHGILGKPFPCDLCTKVFYEPKLLKNHMKRLHRVGVEIEQKPGAAKKGTARGTTKGTTRGTTKGTTEETTKMTANRTENEGED